MVTVKLNSLDLRSLALFFGIKRRSGSGMRGAYRLRQLARRRRK